MSKDYTSLFKKLHPDEPDRYESYFKKSYWTINEFSSLVYGFDPTRFEEIADEEQPPKDPNEEKKAVLIFKLGTRFLKDWIEAHKKNPYESDFLGDYNLSCWKFIKWIAVNSIPMTKRFLKSLPLDLLELLQEFEPTNIDLRTAHRSSRQYHRARFLQHAKRLIQQEASGRLSREAIYRHPSSQNLLREFVKTMGAKKMYGKRTITESWLPEIDPKPPRGAPRKNK